MKPVTFDAAATVQANAVRLSNGKQCFVTHKGVVMGVTEDEFLAATTESAQAPSQ